jgi:hypothetical protein
LSDLHAQHLDLLQAVGSTSLSLGQSIAIAIAITFVIVVTFIGDILEFWELLSEGLLDEILQLVLVKAVVDFLLLVHLLAFPSLENT